MKCSLVFPAWDPSDIFSPKTARSQVSYQHPNGLLYLAGMLIREGHQVELTDGAFFTHEQILERIEAFNPGFVGIYSNTPMWKKAIKTAADIKQKNKGRHVSVGGPHPIAMRQKCFEETDSVDSICYCEGDYVVAELVARLEKGKDAEAIPGLIYRNHSGQIVMNAPRPPIDNLDALPFPPRHLLGDLKKYASPPGTYKRKPIVNMITSRGCTNLCIYCFQIYRDRKIRYRSPENVVNEIEECVKRYGFREVKFLDDQFTGDYERVEEICRLIKERKLDITWYASSIVKTVDKKLLQKMKEAGCWAILYGAESGVQKNLDTLQKNITLAQIRNAVKWAKETGIRPYTPFMFGIPGETFEDGLETVRFACSIDSRYVNFNTLTPFPGTTIYNDIDRYGTMEHDSDKFTFQHAAFVPKSMTKEEIIKLREIAFKKFYSRPSYIAKRIFSIRNWYDITTLLKGAISLFWLWLGGDIFNPAKFKKETQPRS